MGYDIGRAALACLLVLTVVFAASLFPATGLGGFPGGIGDGSAPVAGESGPTETTGPADPPGSTEVPSTSTATGGDGASGATTETATATATETATPTDDEQEAPPADDGGDDGAAGELIAGLVLLIASTVVFGGLVLTIGSATGLLVVKTVGPTGRVVVDVAGRRIDVGGGLQGLSRASMGYVFALSSASGRLLSGLGDLATSASVGLGALARGSVALAAIPAAVGRGLAGVGRGLGALLSFSPGGSLLGGLSLPGIGWSDERSPGTDARTLGSPGTNAGSDEQHRRPPPGDVREVWSRFVEVVPLRNPSARTPGEYARYAVGRGYPADAVGQLTRTFREVRYGDHRESPERFERARTAWEHLREWTADSGEEDDP